MVVYPHPTDSSYLTTDWQFGNIDQYSIMLILLSCCSRFSFLRFHLLVFNGHILNYVWSSPNCYWSSPWFVVVHIPVHSLVSSSILFLQSSNFFWQRCPVVLLESQFQPNWFFDTNLDPFHWGVTPMIFTEGWRAKHRRRCHNAPSRPLEGARP